MEIKGFIESSLLEWEGKLTSVIFLPGCNLRCPYCHAADLVLRPERLQTVPIERVLKYLCRHVGWVDGVAITGGEPTLHGRQLLHLIEQIRDVRMQVLVETNGTRPDRVERLIEGGYVDAISMDVKAPLTLADYVRVAGAEADVEEIRRCIDIIRQSGLPYEFRITLVPGLVGRDELERMLPALHGSRQIALQNFKPDHCLSPELRDVMPYRPDELAAFESLVSDIAERCVVRGREHAVRAA